jgi:hypothetical protein
LPDQSSNNEIINDISEKVTKALDCWDCAITWWNLDNYSAGYEQGVPPPVEQSALLARLAIAKVQINDLVGVQQYDKLEKSTDDTKWAYGIFGIKKEDRRLVISFLFRKSSSLFSNAEVAMLKLKK